MKLKQDIQDCLWKTDTHTYLLPHPLLRPYIAHYTICHSHYMITEQLHLVPDISGCIVMNMKQDSGLDLKYWGPTTRMVTVWKEEGEDQVQYFVEFRPSGSHALFLADQYPYRDMRIELKQVNHRCHALIMEAYDKAEGEASFIQQLDTIFLSMMNKQDDAMAALMQGLSGKARIADVMDSFGYSRRHLQRLVQQRLGCSMKTIQKIQRINQAVSLLKEQKLTLTAIAQQCGFYDQAHFIHDFREICNVTPQQYQKQLQDYYNESFKF